VKSAHAALIDATAAGFEAARPGSTAADLWQAMNSVLAGAGGGTGAGRLGHGLGMSLTEWPSLIPDDHTVIEAGMVLTLEPGIAVDGRILVGEEDILITESGAEWLTSPATAALKEI
jgi:Xaa-Pro aminopeptidase